MIEKKTIIDKIEVTRNGIVQVRFALLLIEDGAEISSTWHRSGVEPGGDVDAMLAAVNEDIATRPALRAPAVDSSKIGLLKAICEEAHTPEVVSAYRAAISAV